MAKATLKEYTVEIGGIKHTLQLAEEDAERYGDAATLVTRKSVSRVTNTAGQPQGNAAAGAETK